MSLSICILVICFCNIGITYYLIKYLFDFIFCTLVLSDPHKRAIFDTVGVKGLETEGWEIVQRAKTPSEIREEYERLEREREERRLQEHTNPKGNVTVYINATDLFSKYDEDYSTR